MIGGTDITIETNAGSAAVETAVRLLQQRWPQAVFEDARTGAKRGRCFVLSGTGDEEVFVYRDEDIAQEWDDKGADPELANTMLHLLLKEGILTIVLDDPSDPFMIEYLESLRNALLLEPANG